MSMITSRRAMLGASLLAVPAAVTATTIGAAPIPMADTNEWDRALHDHRVTKAAMDQAERDYEAVAAKFNAIKPPEPDAAALFPYADQYWILRVADLDTLERNTRRARVPSADDRLRVIEHVREYRTAEKKARDSTGYDEASDRYDKATDAFCAVEGRLMDMPAPNRAALLWKLERALNTDSGELEPYTLRFVAQTQADMRRLLSTEA